MNVFSMTSRSCESASIVLMLWFSNVNTTFRDGGVVQWKSICFGTLGFNGSQKGDEVGNVITFPTIIFLYVTALIGAIFYFDFLYEILKRD